MHVCHFQGLPSWVSHLMHPLFMLYPIILQSLAQNAYTVPLKLKKMPSNSLTSDIRLHLSCRHHLLSEMVLVLANGAVPPSDGLVLTHHNVFGDLVEQSEDMLAQLLQEEKTSTYLKSWETTTTPPENALIASAKESMVGISRPLVGSSRSNMLGDSIASKANTTLLR